MKDLQEFHDDLEALMGLEWKDAWNIYKLPAYTNPERADEIWARYDLFELTGNPEQIMLAQKLKPLAQTFREIIKCLPRPSSKR
jgi:hypothetical protein